LSGIIAICVPVERVGFVQLGSPVSYFVHKSGNVFRFPRGINIRRRDWKSDAPFQAGTYHPSDLIRFRRGQQIVSPADGKEGLVRGQPVHDRIEAALLIDP
jgi:hypothetical protein